MGFFDEIVERSELRHRKKYWKRMIAQLESDKMVALRQDADIQLALQLEEVIEHCKAIYEDIDKAIKEK